MSFPDGINNIILDYTIPERLLPFLEEIDKVKYGK